MHKYEYVYIHLFTEQLRNSVLSHHLTTGFLMLGFITLRCRCLHKTEAFSRIRFLQPIPLARSFQQHFQRWFAVSTCKAGPFLVIGRVISPLITIAGAHLVDAFHPGSKSNFWFKSLVQKSKPPPSKKAPRIRRCACLARMI